MKNKKVTYILLVVSIGLWGFIGWKVYSAFNVTQPEVPTVKKEATAVVKDSILLLLNYRDPFLGKYSSTPTVKVKDDLPVQRKPVPIAAPVPKAEPASPNVQYKGIINVGNTSMAMVQTNAGVLTIKVGEEVDGFKLTRIDDNKIVLSKERRKYEIPIQ